MQINSAIFTLPALAAKTTMPAPSNSPLAHDQIVIKFPANSYTQLVDEARAMPDVRSDIVSEFSKKVTTLLYPPPDIIEGLTSLIGGALNASLKPSQPGTPSASSPALD